MTLVQGELCGSRRLQTWRVTNIDFCWVKHSHPNLILYQLLWSRRARTKILRTGESVSIGEQGNIRILGEGGRQRTVVLPSELASQSRCLTMDIVELERYLKPRQPARMCAILQSSVQLCWARIMGGNAHPFNEAIKQCLSDRQPSASCFRKIMIYAQLCSEMQ